MKVASVSWQDKVHRAEFLSGQAHATGELLRFYGKILHFQRDVQAHLPSGPLHISMLAPFVPQLLRSLRSFGTPEMSELAEAAMDLDWSSELESCWNARLERAYTPLSLIALALLQPFAHACATRGTFEAAKITPQCPFCQCRAQLGVLRPEGDGGKRYLLCSLCGTEWEYRRVICLNCEEVDKEKLPVFTNDMLPHVKVAGCETCHAYLKCIDLGIDGRAVPAVDDIASLSMSLRMATSGFHALSLNLLGF